MSNLRPTEGFETQQDAVLHLSKEGLSAEEIADRIGISRRQVYTVRDNLRQRAKQEGRPNPMPDARKGGEVAGYSSRSAAVRGELVKGSSPEEIAEMVGTVPSEIRRVMRANGLMGRRSVSEARSQHVLRLADHPEGYDPERMLWCSVVLQAMTDLALGAGSSRQHDVRERSDVIRWVGAYQSKDFREVCWKAGVDPDMAYPFFRRLCCMPPEAVKVELARISRESVRSEA